MTKAVFIETFNGYDYFRDEFGNIYTKIKEEILFCSNLKRGQLTLDKSEPNYAVNDVELVYNEQKKLEEEKTPDNRICVEVTNCGNHKVAPDPDPYD